MPPRAQTIQIFLPDGDPTSIKIADLTNRLIEAVLIPRNKLLDCNRAEIRKHGIYFLFGVNEEKSKPIAYIGETDDCLERLKTHNKTKDFWTHALVISSKSNAFTKSHVKYLEYICIKTAAEIGRYDTDNLTAPAKVHITESMEADLLDNFETIKVLLSTLGYPIFEETRSLSLKKKDLLFCKGNNISAEGQLLGDGFVVFKGSSASMDESKSIGTWVSNLRQRLKDDKVLQVVNGCLEFSQDYVFASPSAAAASILGRAANGWTYWKNIDGKTMDDLYRTHAAIPVDFD